MSGHHLRLCRFLSLVGPQEADVGFQRSNVAEKGRAARALLSWTNRAIPALCKWRGEAGPPKRRPQKKQKSVSIIVMLGSYNVMYCVGITNLVKPCRKHRKVQGTKVRLLCAVGECRNGRLGAEPTRLRLGHFGFLRRT
jgi:hypothetical protein